MRTQEYFRKSTILDFIYAVLFVVVFGVLCGVGGWLLGKFSAIGSQIPMTDTLRNDPSVVPSATI